MNKSKTRIAVFPGTFDPMTNGHLDVIERGSVMFDQLVVAVGENPDKSALFNQDERAEIIADVVANMSNVKVAKYTGLTIDYVRATQGDLMLRGIRNSSDLQFEFQVALTNRVTGGIETIFIMTKPEFAFISSSLIKQIAQMGADVSALVPAQVAKRLKSKLSNLP